LKTLNKRYLPILSFLLIISSHSAQAFFTNDGAYFHGSQCESYIGGLISQGREAYCEDAGGGIYLSWVWMGDGTACPSGQSVNPVGGGCYTPNITPQNCVSQVQGGGVVGAYITGTNSQGGTNVTCQIGNGGSGSGTPSGCGTAGVVCIGGAPGGSTPPPPNTPNGQSPQCGSFNGSAVCVTPPPSVSSVPAGTGGNGQAPSGVASVGTINSPSSSPTTTTTTTNNTSNNTTTTTSTTTTTQESTTTEAVFDESQIDPTGQVSGTPTGIVTCEDGTRAADLNSCDHNLSCDFATQYVLYGVCMDAPRQTTTTTTSTTSSTTTTTNNATGEEETETTTSVSNTPTPTPNNNSNGTVTVQMDPPECDPNIQYCGGGFGETDNYAPDETLTYESIFQEFSGNLQSTEVASAITSFFEFNQTGSCPIWSASIPYINVDVTIDQLCADFVPWSIIYGAFLAVCLLLSARIALT